MLHVKGKNINFNSGVPIVKILQHSIPALMIAVLSLILNPINRKSHGAKEQGKSYQYVMYINDAGFLQKLHYGKKLATTDEEEFINENLIL